MHAPVALGLTAAAIYAIATAMLLARPGVVSGARDPWLAATGLAALAVHALALWRSIATPAGVILGLFDSASLVAWVVVALWLVPAVNRAARTAGLIVVPLAALLALAPLLAHAPTGHALDGFGVRLHAAVSILAYAVLALSACQALLLAWQDRRLRARRPAAALALLPPLDTQERWLFGLVGVGFVLLGIALASGLVFVDDMLAQHLVHKTVLSVAAWLVFGVLLLGRWRLGWRGRTAVGWCLGGFATLALAYFGSKAVLELILDRPWFSG